MTDAPTALEQVREDLGLSPIELWWRYFALGGNLTPLEIRAMLAGALVGAPDDLDLLAAALNEERSLTGRCAHLPYVSDGAGETAHPRTHVPAAQRPAR